MHNALKHFTLIFSTWVCSLEEKYSEWDVIVQCRCDCEHDIHLLSASNCITDCARCIIDPAYEEVNNAFERALVFLHKVCLLDKPSADCF